jgi:hypothetical protein
MCFRGFSFENQAEIPRKSSGVQVLIIEELFKGRVSNVVFMGMGEPLMNLPALLPAVRALNQVGASVWRDESTYEFPCTWSKQNYAFRWTREKLSSFLWADKRLR